jgi:hypothetical protein|tara:strand:+ start:11 stop:442 length:432 start_codon:yes stop_codon:yes gene_type:complete
MNNKERMKQILKETIDYYAEDPDNRRSIDKDGNCNYTWGDTHCAVGRYLKPEYQKESWEENNRSVFQLAQYSDDYDIDQFLVKDVQGLDLGFWRNMQDFHDSHSCWITEEDYNKDEEPIGLSRVGKDNYRTIERKINMGGYDG